METSNEIEKLLSTFRQTKKESLTIDEKKERNENLKKEIITGVFECLAKRPMAISEYILYCERFDLAKNEGRIYNIRNFTNDLGLTK